MKLTEYIGSQFGNPRGVVGKLCCLIMNIINRAMYKGVIKQLDLNESAQLLDIGYGNGYLIKKVYYKSHCWIKGIDVSKDMQDQAALVNQRGIQEGRIQLSVGDCCDLPWEDFSFEAITSINTIYFWSNTKKGLAEIYRSLKPNGIFVNAMYSKQWLENLAYTKKGFKLFEPDEIAEYAREVGFKKVEIKSVNKAFIIICYK